VIDRLSKQYPRFVFRVTQISTDLPGYRALRERDIELIIGRLPRLATEDDLEVEALFDDPLVVAAGVHSRWSRVRRISLAQLVDELWILPPPEQFFGALITDLFRSCGLERPKHGVACASLHMNDSLLATGRYLAIYSMSRIKLNAKRLSIKIPPVKLPAQASRVGILRLKNRTLSPIAQLFIKNMRAIVPSLVSQNREGKGEVRFFNVTTARSADWAPQLIRSGASGPQASDVLLCRRRCVYHGQRHLISRSRATAALSGFFIFSQSSEEHRSSAPRSAFPYTRTCRCGPWPARCLAGAPTVK